MKDFDKNNIRYPVLICCLVGVAIYGMSTANLTVGLLLLAAGCLLYALEKGRIYTEDEREAIK